MLFDFELRGKAMGGVASIGHGGGSWLALTLFSIVATAATILICLNSSQLGTLTRLIDRPDLGRKLHAKDTPIVGGLAMMVPVLILTLLEALIFHVEVFMLAATFAASVVLAIGVLDDRLDLSAAWRLIGLFFVVFVAFSVEPIFVVHSIGFDVFGVRLFVPFHSLAAPITLLMIVGFVNATNMADGMNGQFLGSVLVWTILLLRYVPPADFAPLAGLFCCAAAALVFNLRGRVFSGSAGAYSGALFIALCTIAVYRQTRSNLAAQTVAIWFWLPVLDCVRLMTTRALVSRSPLSGDRRHLHHILLSIMRHKYALVTYLVLLGLPAFVTELNTLAGLYCLLGCTFVYCAIVASQREVGATLGAGTALNAGE